MTQQPPVPVIWTPDEVQIGWFPKRDCEGYDPSLPHLTWRDLQGPYDQLGRIGINTYAKGTLITAKACGKLFYRVGQDCGCVSGIYYPHDIETTLLGIVQTRLNKGKLEVRRSQEPLEKWVWILFGLDEEPEHITGIVFRRAK
jgi:hypothetical protein